ncbi:S8 family serine peptidase [Streptomyces phyllanthi]|uniref:S8 family serine peptidase n=1 Tax=Streptomyces phyllanthi TaxID=1803180 RepID=A0A5N8VUT9_9ACTN|nr:S8 family serine peptidase [Streptomyces phyllanthi]MPY38446.1 S8 family serine peptidase [Streptomyces phyllanthi]
MRNKHRRPGRHRHLAYGTAALLAVAGLAATTALVAPTSAGATPDAATGSSAGSTTKVTLITGDTVGVTGGSRVIGVDRGKGRAKVPYSVQSLGGHTYVIPDDAAPLVASGRLDRRLFDVTQLVADGYDDSHRRTLPLIVSYRGSARTADDAKRALLSADVEVKRQLPSLHGESVTADKPDAVSVWAALTRPTQEAVTTERGIDRVWLDGKVEARPSQDEDPDPTQGTAQIHAPDAWKAGYDGKGVKIAVLDSGLDATHPDLKGSIAGSKDFTGENSTDDRLGHGTHVASTLVGSGARSGGKYKGVAPGAKLLVGRVLNGEGDGGESGIIAGMQWAVKQGAKVISMSLGGDDTPGVDPMEQAANDLSASSGALFVMAAGNEGPKPGTIDSPGAASAALTVAAVDSQDKLADFSSRGPDTSHELKPDISAPGVDIIAAKATHGSLGDPAGPGYVRMSGTSMATPHVSAAAAILAQEHPDWTGQRIKAALMASTVAMNGSDSPYERGTGRVDLARAIRQTVIADTPSISFGQQLWPHNDDQPVTKTLTYRNTGTEPVTLDLSLAGDAPAGMFTVSPSRVTVPAGGTATAAVTADTRVGTEDGAYGATITASAQGANGESVRTTLGAVREAESYDLTLKGIGRDGKPNAPHRLDVIGLDNGKQWFFADDGSSQASASKTKIRVPRGRYLISAQLTPDTDEPVEVTQLVAPRLNVNRTTTVTLDARKAKPFKVTAPDPRARLSSGAVVIGARGAKPEYDYADWLGLGDNDVYSRYFLGQVGPSAPAGDFIAQAGGVWQRGTTGDVYDLVTTRRGSFFTGLTRTYSARGLAKVVTSIGSNAKGSLAAPTAYWSTPGWPALSAGPAGGTGSFRPVPAASVVHHVYTGDGLRWDLGPGVTSDSISSTFKATAPRRYSPGRTYRETYNTGVFGPLTTDSKTVGDPGAVRAGEAYAVCVPMLSDGAGHANYDAGTTRFHLTSGSRTIADIPANPCGAPLAGLLPQKATYRLAISTSQSAGSVTVGGRASAVWTFTSSPTADNKVERLPLSVVRFTPKLSLTSTAKAGTELTVPIRLQGPAAKRGAVKSLVVKVSYDGGRTWKSTTVHTAKDGKRHLTLTSPARPTTVGLKATLVDRDGNTVTETLPSAYRTVR